MNKPVFLPFLIGACILSACAQGPYKPLASESHRATLADKFILLDKESQGSITCTGLEERFDPSGRLEVVAHIANTEEYAVNIQVGCVFKDAQGFSTGDEVPFQIVSLGGGQTADKHFTAMNTQAETYTIRVRKVR